MSAQAPLLILTRKGRIKIRLAAFTAAEDEYWQLQFAWAKDHGSSNLEADKYAWSATVAKFPRLKDYTGAQP